MENQITNYNWPRVILLILVSIVIGFGYDYLTEFKNDYAFGITMLVSVVSASIFRPYLIRGINVDLQKAKATEETKNRFDIAYYTFWSYIEFYLISTFVWGLTMYALRLIPYVKDNFDLWYISIILTQIVITLKGDLILYYWFKIQGQSRIFKYKEYLLNQQNIKLIIFISYFLALFWTYSSRDNSHTELWIKTFATYVAFDRLVSNWIKLTKESRFSA